MNRIREGWPQRLRDTIDRRAITNRRLENDYVALPRGTLVTIIGATSWDKFNVKSRECEHCHAATIITGVPAVDLALVPEAELV
jgi:hypothetical protein